MRKSIFSYCLIFLCSACIDRITFETEVPSAYPVVIDGYISDQPGPYTIKVSKSFDIESKLSIKTPISVKRLTISDDAGNSEDLKSIAEGEYQTNPFGIQGVVGRTYKIRVELLDGRIFESKPDKMLPAGSVDDVYFQYREQVNSEQETEYGFDILFNSSAGTQDDYYFLWKFVGTFKYDTNPELYTIKCGESDCPKPLPCSSYIVGQTGELENVKPCECCTCWANIFNPEPIISDNQAIRNGKFVNVNAAYVPITEWTFMHKVHAEIQQLSLSPQAFAFWKAVKDQKKSAGSLFEPQSGKIPSNFIQVSGTQSPIEGLFYATSINSKSVYITRSDVPGIIPSVELPFKNTCKELFPYSSVNKPIYWED